jgi:hypothetical protein
MFTATLAGVKSVGATGAGATVVKLNMVDHALVPVAFFALERQKYVVTLLRPLTDFNPAVSVESSTIGVAKALSVDT